MADKPFVPPVADPYGNGQPLYTPAGHLIAVPLPPPGLWSIPREPEPRPLVTSPPARPWVVPEQLNLRLASPPDPAQETFLSMLDALVRIEGNVARIAANVQPARPTSPNDAGVQPAPAQGHAPSTDDTPAKVVAKIAASFVHGAPTYTDDFNRFLLLLPEEERMWLPKEERAAHQTPGPELVSVYRGKHPGSESHLLKILYAVRRKP